MAQGRTEPLIEPALLNLSEAAKLLGVGTTYLSRSDAPRLALPSTAPNGRPTIRYDREQLLSWARAFKVGAA